MTGSIGLVTLTCVTTPRQLPLALMPIIFAIQQGIEGWLWLVLSPDANTPLAHNLTFGFLLVAQPVWPIYVPIALLLANPLRSRRRLMLGCLLVGIGTGLYLLGQLLARPHGASIIDGHIVYLTETPLPLAIGLAYLGATALPLLLSSQRTLVLLGAIVVTGSIIAYVYYWSAFMSVWCFFAAAASVVMLFHFLAVERNHRTAAAH